MNKNTVKIILIATDAKKKSLVFVDENLKIYSLKEAIDSAKDGLFENVYAVNRSGSFYLRASPSAPKEDKLDYISISSYQLFYSLNNLSKILSVPAFKNYWEKYQQILLQEQQKIKDACIIIDGHPRITKEIARLKLMANKDIIFVATKKFDVDPYLLAGILIDELARLNPIEDITDMLAGYFIGINTSVGIGQVTTNTAKNLMIAGYYNPDPNKFTSKGKIKNATRRQIYEYLKEPRHNIFFAAAAMCNLIDSWKNFINLNEHPEILATLYSLDRKPHLNPQPNDRGLQITNEFYNLAKEWLK